jgi:hypothetical protein
LMDGIKCKPKSATGRINADTVLVRVVKWMITKPQF